MSGVPFLSNRPHIVFLDASTVDLGDVNLSPLKRLGTYLAFQNTLPSQTILHAQNADIVVTNKVIFDRAILGQLPKLKLICIAATGVNNVDRTAAAKKGIAVTNVAAYSTTTVVEHTFMLLLAFAHRLIEHHNGSVRGMWSRSPHFTLLDYPFSDLKGKNLGIIGYGHIGKEVSCLARAFGIHGMIAKIPGRTYPKKPRRYPLNLVLKRSDFVALHCPLTRQTHHLIGHEAFKKMKKTAYLINMARGPIVDEQALITALEKNQIAGYGSDVMEKEPPEKSHPLFQSSLGGRVLMTPHVAWASRESRQRLIHEIALNIESFMEGKTRNRVA